VCDAGLAVERPARDLARGTGAREFVEVFEEVRLVGGQVATLGSPNDGAVGVDQVDAGVDQRGDVPRRGDAGEIERGVGGRGLARLDDGVDERAGVAHVARRAREDVGVGPVVRRGVGRDDGGTRELDVGVVDGESVLDLVGRSRGEAAVREDGENRIVALGHVAVCGPETARVRDDVVREAGRDVGVGQAEFAHPRGPVAPWTSKWSVMVVLGRGAAINLLSPAGASPVASILSSVVSMALTAGDGPRRPDRPLSALHRRSL